MTETSINYAKALYELSVPEEAVLETEKIFRSTPQLKGALENPLVSLKEKEHVIDRVFPQEMKNFLKVTCKYQKISSIYDILEAYGNYSRKQKGILKAVLTYVTTITTLVSAPVLAITGRCALISYSTLSRLQPERSITVPVFLRLFFRVLIS